MTTQNNEPWKYAPFDGAERLQMQQTAKMTFIERLQALDEMICLALKVNEAACVAEKQPPYGTGK